MRTESLMKDKGPKEKGQVNKIMCEERLMGKLKIDNKNLQRDMEHVMKDADQFLSNLKGHKRARGRVKKDVQRLKEHLSRLIKHLKHLESEYVQSSGS